MFQELSVTPDSKRDIANKRAAELKLRIHDYLHVQKEIKTGFNQQTLYQANKNKIIEYFGGSEGDWSSWKWQMKHRITDIAVLGRIFNLSPAKMKEIEEVGKTYRWAVSPYYASLMDLQDTDCPVAMQALPCYSEIQDCFGKADPMEEDYTSPAPAITRRYPDRLIINVSNMCAMYCRHCQRKRNIGEIDHHTPREKILAALDYIRKHKEIRDVLITGGDALLLSNKDLDWLLTQLDNIAHIEIKRIGTRTLVTLPQRVTENLCEVLSKHPPIYINTQFNHPREITPEVAEACDRLVRAGAVLGNQAVLLKGINNNPHVMKKLNHELLKVRIRPYYIFHAKAVKGSTHFITRIEEGVEIMEKLRGFTSGLAVPTYIINAPKGYGKTPMLPEYLISHGQNHVTIRTWEKKVLDYPNISPEY